MRQYEMRARNCLQTIAKERLELGGDEWLQIATILSIRTNPLTAYKH